MVKSFVVRVETISNADFTVKIPETDFTNFLHFLDRDKDVSHYTVETLMEVD